MRASVYNSMPLEGAEALAAFMQVWFWTDWTVLCKCLDVVIAALWHILTLLEC